MARMNIAFLGFDRSIDFAHIGGMDSLVRRLALRLAELGDQIEFVHYDAEEEKSERPCDGIELRYFKRLDDALEHLVSSDCDHVVSIYLRPRERLAYARFRRAQKKSIWFHHVYSCWHESRIKRELLFAEARRFPFNGTLFCISPRIHQYVSRWAPRAALLWPSVPNSFFCQPEEKTNPEKLCLTYAGRIDHGKGITSVLEVFERLAAYNDIETHLCGFAWSHQSKTVRLHERLLADSNIRYEMVKYEGWSPQVEENLRLLLRKTDILLLPYKKLSSTIDTPLLLLEGMANLCAVITPALGDLYETYGNSEFNLGDNWNADGVVGLVQNSRMFLEDERQRLQKRNSLLQFNTNSVVEKFRRLLLGNI